MTWPIEITVIGDLIADVWLTGHAHHLSREAPVPTIHVDTRQVRPGGAGNAAANLAAMGAHTRIVASVGPDSNGRALRAALLDEGVEIFVAPLLSTTHAKTRAVVDGQILARIDEVAPEPCRWPLVDLPRRGAVLIADYGLGMDRLVEELMPLRAGWDFLVVDSHTPEAWSALRPDVITPNWSEASALLPPLRSGDRRSHVLAQRQVLLESTNARMALVTLDRDGCVLLTNHDQACGWTTPVAERFTIGAGDSATAALTLALLEGSSIEIAVARAAAAARCAIRREGTTVVTASDVEAELHRPIDIRGPSLREAAPASWPSTS